MIASGTKAKVDGYVNAVLSGEIVVCSAVRQAVERYIRDLDRQSTQEFPYYFSPNLAASACDFFPLLLRHSIGDFANLPFELESWQAFAIWNIFGWKRDADDSRRFRKFYWSMARKNGKALALDTVLPTPDGFTTMGEVQPGDYLIGANGEPVLVQAATEVMEDRPCYRMEFSTGEVIYCDEQHEWVTEARVVNVGAGVRGPSGIKLAEPSTKTTRQIAETVVYGKRGDRNHSISLMSSPAQFPHREFEIEPYTLGAWLGDGNTNCGRITNAYSDNEIIDRISQDCFFLREVKSSNKNSGAYSITGLGPALRRIGVLNNKHIPRKYLKSSVSQRMELLRGLMDTDGTISKKGQCEYVSISKKLAEDVHELLCSLGIKATILEHDAKLNGRVVSKKYRVYFFAFQPFVPFALERKAKRVPESPHSIRPRSKTRQIVSCQKVDSMPVRCVQVEGGMYCCTRSYIPTHNSSIAAGIALYLAMMDVNPVTGRPEDVAEVILCATKKEQAEKVIYAEIERMRLRSPEIEEISSRINKQITFSHNSGSIRCVGSDKPYDGLNPHSVLMDELHAWREYHRKFYDTIITGSGYRRQPLIGTVTTAGDDKSHLWKDEYGYAKGILDQTITDESVFAYFFELDEDDDPLDEANWIKANPNLGVSVRLDYLRQMANEAKEKSLALNRFIRYHGNRIVTSTEKAFDLIQWDRCEGELSDWHDADAIGGGVDLGGRDDLAAFAMVARFPMDEERDGKPVYRYELRCWAYIAHDTERDLAKQPFASWVYQGLINKCRFPTADLRDDLIEHCGEYGVWAVAYDPYNAQPLGDDLTAEGITAATCAQTQRMFNEPIRTLIEALRDGRITHDGNPLLRWCAGNAVISRDRTDRWMYDKRESSDKIDPIVAVTMAFRMASLAPTKATGNLYL